VVKVPEILLEGVSSEGDGIVMHELIARLLPPILIQVVKQGGGILPADLADELTTGIGGAVEALGGGAAKLFEGGLKGTGEGLKDVFQGAEKLLKKNGESDDADGEKKPGLLEGILGGKKDENKE